MKFVVIKAFEKPIPIRAWCLFLFAALVIVTFIVFEPEPQKPEPKSHFTQFLEAQNAKDRKAIKANTNIEN